MGLKLELAVVAVESSAGARSAVVVRVGVAGLSRVQRWTSRLAIVDESDGWTSREGARPQRQAERTSTLPGAIKTRLARLTVASVLASTLL